MIDVNMTTIAVGFFVIFTQDINYDRSTNQEATMPYRMSRLYLSGRLNGRLFFPGYFATVGYVQLTGFSVFGIFWISMMENMGVSSENGQTLDLYTYGVIIVLVSVLLHHF